MQRRVLIGVCVVWAVVLVSCTGAGGKWFDLPGGQAIYRSDYRDYYFSNNAGGPYVDAHITDVAFDDRFILLRRDVSEHYSDPKPKYRLTGKIEFYIVDVSVSPAKKHGPFTEAEFGPARERLGVPPDLRLEPTDTVSKRVRPPRE
jgi:hypothetical protein